MSQSSSGRLGRRLARTRLMLRTPLPMLLDKVGLMRRPYKVSWNHGVPVEIRPGVHGERYIFYEVFMKSAYFSAGQRLRPGDTVIDVGANVGFFSIQAASIVGPTGVVIAIEPHPETFAQLQRNIAVSGVKNIRARRMAVSDRTGEATFFFGETPGFNSLFQEVDDQDRNAHTQQEQVQTATLADLMRDEGLDHCHHLKLDCEGAEYGICETLPADLAQRIDQITMEVHLIPGHEPAEIERVLTASGFRSGSQGRLFNFSRLS